MNTRLHEKKELGAFIELGAVEARRPAARALTRG